VPPSSAICGIIARGKLLPDLDYMHIAGDATPDYLTRYPDEYDLPDIEIDQVRYAEGNNTVVERTFHTPAADISDRTKIPPGGMPARTIRN